MFAADLARVLGLSRTEKLIYLARLAPADAEAIEWLINDCLAHRWPTTLAEWITVADRLGARH